jgi:transcriptional regulator
MYVPEAFQVTDPSVIRSFLEQHSFGMLMINGHNGFPIVTHLPFLIRFDDDCISVEGHLAKANPMAEYLSNGRTAKIVINGAHGYVSSSVYGHVNVPTYNYQAAHLLGTIDLLSSEELRVHLAETVRQYEANRKNPIQIEELPVEMVNSYMNEISGFRLTVFRTEVAFKLSQNRNEDDFQRIISDLKHGNAGQQQLAAVMQQWEKKSV